MYCARSPYWRYSYPCGRRELHSCKTYPSGGRLVIWRQSSSRTLWLGLGTVAFELLLAVLLTSLLRGLIGRTAWRAVHWLGYAAWPVAVAHGLGTGTDAWSLWVLLLTAACVVAVGWAVFARITLPGSDPLMAARARFRDSSRR